MYRILHRILSEMESKSPMGVACASTTDVYNRAVEVFDSMWLHGDDKEPLRQLGIWTGGFSRYDNAQVSMFSNSWKQEALDNAIDKIRLPHFVLHF